MPFPSTIESLTLRVTTGVSPNVEIFEQDILPSDLSGTTNNSVQIAPNSSVFNAFNTKQPGTIFNASIITTYDEGTFITGDTISTASVSNYVPNPLILSSFGSLSYNYVSGGVGTFTLSQPSSNSNSPGAFTYSVVGTTGIVSVSTNVVTMLSAGSTTIRATQAAAGGYTSAYVDANVTINPIAPTFGSFSIASRDFGAIPFTLTAPTSNSSGAFTYTSSTPSVATVSGNTVTVVGEGTSTITATQAATTNYTSGTIDAPFVVNLPAPTLSSFSVASRNFGDIPNTFTLTAPISNVLTTSIITSTASAMIEPPNIDTLIYGAPWTQIGGDIDGESAGDQSGFSVACSGDGNIIAVGARFNSGSYSNAGHVRVYIRNSSKLSSNSLGPAGWDQIGGDIDGEAYDNFSGSGVSLSASGRILAIGANYNSDGGIGAGQVRVYIYNESKTTANSLGPAGWDKLGGDIDGEYAGDESGGGHWNNRSIELSADGTIIAIGAFGNDGNGRDSGHVRVYKYNPSKSTAQTNQSLAGFGPIGWDRLGADIDGEAAYNDFGWSVSLSSDGTKLITGARYNDGTSGNSADNRGSARVYNIPTTNALTYSSSNPDIADIYGNLLLIRGVNGSITITASQTGNTITGRLDVVGTTYTLQYDRYNIFTYTSSTPSVATISGNIATVVGAGTSTITATQSATTNYTSGTIDATLTVTS